MPAPSQLQRVAFSPGEFATLFGKSQTWGYRQLYAGKVKAITEHGRMLIPAAEVERILVSAGVYDGRKTPIKTKADAEALKPHFENAWREFLRARKTGKAEGAPRSKAKFGLPNPGARKAALARLSGKGKSRSG